MLIKCQWSFYSCEQYLSKNLHFLQAVQSYFDVPLNLMIVNPAHTPNWDMVADVVNSCSRVYRSPKQCRLRYENVIIPREEGRIMYDITPRKQKKQKGIYKMVTMLKDSNHAILYTSLQSHKNRLSWFLLDVLRLNWKLSCKFGKMMLNIEGL